MTTLLCCLCLVSHVDLALPPHKVRWDQKEGIQTLVEAGTLLDMHIWMSVLDFLRLFLRIIG